MKLADNVTVLPGIGKRKAQILEKLGIHTLEDVIYSFPRSYEDRRNVVSIDSLRADIPALFKGEIEAAHVNRYRGRKGQVVSFLVSDGTGSVEVVFFNAPYLAKTIKIGSKYAFFGKPAVNRDRLQVIHPEISKISEIKDGILPIYPLTKGISQRDMRNMQNAVRCLYGEAEDFLSSDTVAKHNLCSIEHALENVHFPRDRRRFLEARFRLVFEEFLVLQTGLMAARQGTANIEGVRCDKNVSVDEYIASMGFPLTGAQTRCVKEIMEDLESPQAMNRLVQGDVGSGKTAVAEIAMYKAVKCGYQAVMMAPTEILAMQHYEGFNKSFEAHGIKVGFLSGSMKVSEKRETLEALYKGKIQILVGTHAVIQPEVKFQNLGLVITDEQHRFGVNQRISLKTKGHNPNILVMTATPIPRTLAVVLYGDLDISIIDEMPPGRQKIITKTYRGSEGGGRNSCYDFARKQIESGRQAYVVTPLIEDSELIDARSAEQVHRELEERFVGYEVALLHGAMKQSEKDAIMERFYKGEIQVLVATVVIEVGINVPNATVMVIENAERFGLAQLHQLRGRVGRGKHQSYCFLLIEGGSEMAERRGQIMEQSSDGFYIAEEDLKLRGPGEIFGTRQHGLPDMKIGDMAKHLDVMNHARDEAKAILEADPALKRNENKALRRRITRIFGEDFALNL